MRVVPVLLAFLVATALGGPASAQEESTDDAAPIPTTLSVDVEPAASADLATRLRVGLQTEDGAPVSGARVVALARVELIGERTVALGAGVTDATGYARVAVTPREAEQLVIATFAGDERYAATTVEVPVTYPAAAVTPYTHEHREHALLDPVRQRMPEVITVLVAALWLGLIALTVTTLRSIRQDTEVSHARGSREEAPT